MKRCRFGLSIALGVMLTMGLLVGFSLVDDSALASTADPQARSHTGPSNQVRAQDAVSTAYVVVRFGDNDAIVREIPFTQPITAHIALERAGLNPVVADNGFLCRIGDLGQARPDGSGCDNGTRYWGTYYWGGDAWKFRMVGVDQAVISQTGHVEGFSWSDPGYAGVEPPHAPALVSAKEGLDWLHEQQKADGSFGSVNYTAEVLMAVSANKLDASTWRSSPSLLANVLSNGEEFASLNSAGAGKLAVALAAQESCWPIGAMKPLSHYHPTSGTFSTDTLYQAWGILGTAALSDTAPISAVESLKENQQPNGGWELFAGFGADTNSTALAIEALVAAGEPVTSTSIVSGLNYLENAQNVDGGFPYSPDSPYGTDSDTNSTAYVVQALFAAGEDPLSGQWAISETNPISYLLSMQLPNGSFEWQDGFGANQIATQQAIPALLHRSLPMMIDALESCYGISGQVVSDIEGVQTGLEGVAMEAEGADDLFFGSTDATGTYTLSVSRAGTYTLTPTKGGFTFSPTLRTAEVGGSLGEISQVSHFKGGTQVYLPLIIRY